MFAYDIRRIAFKLFLVASTLRKPTITMVDTYNFELSHFLCDNNRHSNEKLNFDSFYEIIFTNKL